MAELTALSPDQLQQEQQQIRKQLLEARFDRAVGRLLDLSAPRRLRKQLARVLTCLHAVSDQKVAKQ
ncbi:MAG: 50S ribosomal protein L29 [Myxococcota bacterium]